MKNILVPTDFSDCANYATDLAIELAEKVKGKIHFLHISSVPTDWITMNKAEGKPYYLDVGRKIKKANQALDRFVAKAEKKGVTAQSHLVYNKDFTYIVKVAKLYKNDLIIMGSQGSTGAREIFIGSVAQKVVRLATIPVLTVKKPIKLNSIRKVMFAADFEEKVMPHFKEVVKLSKLISAELHLVFINTLSNFHNSLEIKTKMGNYALHAPRAVTATHVFSAYDLEAGLQHAVDDLGCHLVVMITHGRRKSQRLFVGSATERAINHLSIPILGFHFNRN